MTIKKITLLILTLITLLSCEDKLPEELVLTNYPMSIGTSWTFEKLWIIRNYTSATSDSIENSDTVKIAGTTWIDKDTIINKTKLLVFKTQEIGPTQTTTSFQYCYMDKDGFKTYAYRNGEDGFASNNSMESSMQKIVQLRSIGKMYSQKQATDEIYIYNTPILNIKYPLTKNSEWTSDSSADNGISITKNVIGTDTLLINSHECASLKVEYNYPSGNSSISTIQWISKEGLLKEESNFGTFVHNPYKFESLMHMTVLSVNIK